jgi:hypothetical protein
MFDQVDEFHSFTFLEWLAPLDLQMPWLEWVTLPQPPRKWAYPEMCSSNQTDSSGRSHHPMCYAKFWLGIAIHSTTPTFHCKSLSLQDFRREVGIWPADAIDTSKTHIYQAWTSTAELPCKYGQKNMQYVHCNKDSLTNLKVRVICMLEPEIPQNPISSRTVTFRWRWYMNVCPHYQTSLTYW